MRRHFDNIFDILKLTPSWKRPAPACSFACGPEDFRYMARKPMRLPRVSRGSCLLVALMILRRDWRAQGIARKRSGLFAYGFNVTSCGDDGRKDITVTSPNVSVMGCDASPYQHLPARRPGTACRIGPAVVQHSR